MFSTADLPLTMRPDPLRPHACGRPNCPQSPDYTAPTQGADGSRDPREIGVASQA